VVLVATHNTPHNPEPSTATLLQVVQVLSRGHKAQVSVCKLRPNPPQVPLHVQLLSADVAGTMLIWNVLTGKLEV
jgi:hypothetical protein